MSRADLDAHDLRDDGRPAEPPREIDLAEPALAEQPFDAVRAAASRGWRSPEAPPAAEPAAIDERARTDLVVRVVASDGCFSMQSGRGTCAAWSESA